MYHQDRERQATDKHRPDQDTRASRPPDSEAAREDVDSRGSGYDKPRERDGAGLQLAADDGRGAARRPSGGGGNPSIRRPVAWRPSREDWLKKS